MMPERRNEMQEQKKIGFIGLGIIGKPMAKNLVKKGFKVTICGHVRKEPVEELEALGATAVRSPREVAEASNVIISVVRDIPQTEEVMYGKDGLWQAISKGSIIIICSTIDPSYCERLAVAGKGKGVSVLDAPVSGGPIASEAGALTFMIGGEKEVFEECLHIFESMGRNIFHLGDIGMGMAFKLINNQILFGNMVIASEAIGLGLRAGLDLKTMLDVIKVSSGNSYLVQQWDRYIEYRKDYQRRGSASTIAVLYKDQATGLAFAKKVGASLPFATLVAQVDIAQLIPERAE
jgi:3-hydroxyisobutyrate dehydrogenase-like beta-hydroxyacid dehydrogenase